MAVGKVYRRRSRDLYSTGFSGVAEFKERWEHLVGLSLGFMGDSGGIMDVLDLTFLASYL